MYDRLFAEAQPDGADKDLLKSLNLDSLKIVTANVGASPAAEQPDQKFQFELFGYFVADHLDYVAGAKPVFKRVQGLKDSWK